MITKILLTAAAAMAAGVVASSAQVYSANVVGYYNATIPANQYTLLGNQLVNSTSNDLNTIAGSLPNKTTVQTWNGSGFTAAAKGSGGWVPDSTVAVGQGFWIITPASAGTVSNTFVGAVVANTGASVTNQLTGSVYSLVASANPYATDLNDTNNTLNTSTLPNKTTIQIWNGAGFTASAKGSGGWVPDETISVGQGFWIEPPAAGATWVQTLQP